MSIRPDLGPYSLFAHEWVVLGNTAVSKQANNFPLQLVQILGSGALVIFAQRDEHIALAIEDDARAKVVAHRQFGFLAENHLEIFKPGIVRGQLTESDGSSRF